LVKVALVHQLRLLEQAVVQAFMEWLWLVAALVGKTQI
jgi:hypothetical protein